MEKRSIKWRSLTTLILTFGFLLLSVSGIILYIAPRCSVALRLNWSVLGLSKETWSAMHLSSALAIVIASGFHLYFNWGLFMSHLRQKMEKGFRLQRELVIACLFMALLFFGVWYEAPPFSTLVEVHESIKDSWGLPGGGQGAGRQQEQEKGSCDHEEVGAESPAAHRGGQSGGRGQGQGQQRGKASGAMREQSGGRGWGKMTIEALCVSEGVALESGLDRLKAAGIATTKDALLRDLAQAQQLRPHDIVAIISSQASPE